MAPEMREIAYRGSRITVHSTQPFDSIMDKLYSEIGGPEEIGTWDEIDSNSTNKQSFVKAVKKATGTKARQQDADHFMIFQARRYQSS